MSGLIPIFMKPDIADPIQFDAVIGIPGVAVEDAGIVIPDPADEDDANPGVNGIEAGTAADVPEVPTTSAGTAASRALMPGTAFSTCAKSSGFSNDFAMVKSTPAAPAACSGVEPSSLASPLTNSGLALAAVESASICGVVRNSVCARAAADDENTATIAQTAMHEIR